MSGFSFRVDNSPFSQQQADALNQLLATLSPDQMIWLSGYLAGCCIHCKSCQCGGRHPRRGNSGRLSCKGGIGVAGVGLGAA
jgi:hypothetical protein